MIHWVDLQEEKGSGSEESEPIPAATTILATTKSDPPLHGVEKLPEAAGAAALRAVRLAPSPVLDPRVVPTSFVSAPPRVEEIPERHSGDKKRASDTAATANTSSTEQVVEGVSAGDTLSPIQSRRLHKWNPCTVWKTDTLIGNVVFV